MGILDSLAKIFGKRAFVTFRRGERGFIVTGGWSFIALEDSAPFALAEAERGRYINMRVLREDTGKIVHFHGAPSYYLKKLEDA